MSVPPQSFHDDLPIMLVVVAAAAVLLLQLLLTCRRRNAVRTIAVRDCRR